MLSSSESLPIGTLQYKRYLLHIILKFAFFHGKFPAAQWVEHCTAKVVPVGMEVCSRGLTVFLFFKPFFMIFGLFVCFPMVYLVLNTLDAFLFSFKILFQTPKDKGSLEN